MPLILHNESRDRDQDTGPVFSCCGKKFREGPCGCEKSEQAAQENLKAPEIRSAEALEAIRDTMLAILERLGPIASNQRKVS